MATKCDNDIPDCVKLLDSNEWEQGKPAYVAKGVTRYTNGSKMTTGIGAGIYSAQPETCESKSLGKYATVFHAESTS